MRVYTVWKIDNELGAPQLVFGEDIPRNANGTPWSKSNELLYRFEAASNDEAMAIFSLRCGHQPYQPGPPAPCHKCGSVIYPESFGDCWRCGEAKS